MTKSGRDIHPGSYLIIIYLMASKGVKLSVYPNDIH